MPKPGCGEIVGILGPMGTGKSTLVAQAEKLLKAQVFRELPPAENPYFKQFYDALVAGELPNPYVLNSQLTFLQASIDQAKDIYRARKRDQQQVIVWEMPPWGHYMYAWMQHHGEDPIMSETDWKKYSKEFKKGWLEVQKLGVMPGIVGVTLLQNIDELLNRIRIRNRTEEAGVPPDYVAAQLDYWQKRINRKLVLPRKGIKELGIPQAEFSANLVQLDAEHFDWQDQADFNLVWYMLVAQTLQSRDSR
jgi:deoxyadenosine/deoxycytidine kinase